MQKYLNPSEAINALNNHKTIKSKTSDGYILIKKKSKAVYEAKVYTTGVSKPIIQNGTITNVLKTLNDSKVNEGFYIIN